jgi:hypothetical protein
MIYKIIFSAFVLTVFQSCGQEEQQEVLKIEVDTNSYYKLFDFKNFKGVEIINNKDKSQSKYLVEKNKVKYITGDSTIIEFTRYTPQEKLWDSGYKIKIIDPQFKYSDIGENKINSRLYLKDRHLLFTNEVASIYGDNIVILDSLLNPIIFTRAYGKSSRTQLIQYVGGFEQEKIYLIDSTRQTFNYSDSSINNLISKYSNNPKLDYGEPIKTKNIFYDLPYWLNFHFYSIMKIERRIKIDIY